MTEEQEKKKTNANINDEQEKKKTNANINEEQEKKKTNANIQEEQEKKKTSANIQEEQEKKRPTVNTLDELERNRLNVESDSLITKVRHFIPALSPSLAKGQCGKIGIVGGSREYSGAPYFAAITSLKIGADLVYVFCSNEAAITIKSYSPELIVIPILNDKDVLKKMEPWLARLTTLVIGPGLGRDPDLLRNVSDIIKHVGKKYKTPLVVDADGLYIITQSPHLLEDYKGPKILTPNKNEFKKLSLKMKTETAIEIAGALNAVLVQKGPTDIITNGIHFEELELNPRDIVLKCDILGSNRRCGGQGDILAGCLATFVTWFEISKSGSEETDFNSVKLRSPSKKHVWFMDNALGYSLAAYAACCVTRQCSKYTFQKLGRSMTATDMISNLNKSFKSFFNE